MYNFRFALPFWHLVKISSNAFHKYLHTRALPHSHLFGSLVQRYIQIVHWVRTSSFVCYLRSGIIHFFCNCSNFLALYVLNLEFCPIHAWVFPIVGVKIWLFKCRSGCHKLIILMQKWVSQIDYFNAEFFSEDVVRIFKPANQNEKWVTKPLFFLKIIIGFSKKFACM